MVDKNMPPAFDLTGNQLVKRWDIYGINSYTQKIELALSA